MVKKIKVFITDSSIDRISDGRFATVHPVSAEDIQNGILLITDERVFTESEVKTIAMAAVREITKNHVGGITNIGVACGNVAKTFADSGIIFDPTQ